MDATSCGSIYYTQATGAHVVRGAIRSFWAKNGWEKSEVGYPIGEEMPANNNGRLQRFENGAIYWSSATGPMFVYDAARIAQLADA